MTSNDKSDFITVEMFNNGIQEIKLELQNIKSEMQEIKTEVGQIEKQQSINSVKIDLLQHTIYWSLAISGLFMALVGILVAIVALKPLKTENAERQENLSQRNIRDIRSLIREEIAMARSVASSGK